MVYLRLIPKINIFEKLRFNKAKFRFARLISYSKS